MTFLLLICVAKYRLLLFIKVMGDSLHQENFASNKLFVSICKLLDFSQASDSMINFDVSIEHCVLDAIYGMYASAHAL